MSSEEREELLEKAQELGIEFQPNTPSTVLEQRIAEAEAQLEIDTAPDDIEDDNQSDNIESSDDELEGEDKGEEEIPDPEPKPKPKKAVKKKAAPVKREDKVSKAKAGIRARKKKAFETRIVTITNRDNRENDVATTVYLGFENQHFSLSKVVPLDQPVELENCLINITESTTMTLHKAEVKDGRNTGNHRPVTVKKYTISYADQTPD